MTLHIFESKLYLHLTSFFLRVEMLTNDSEIREKYHCEFSLFMQYLAVCEKSAFFMDCRKSQFLPHFLRPEYAPYLPIPRAPSLVYYVI